MNAVKRCLTVLAVALVAGACGGDPTAPEAGTNLSIRATPSAVWMRNNQTAEVLIEAADNLGGATEGSWSVASQVGAFFAAAVDPTYQSTSTGGIGIKTKFVITATGEGDGSVTISGTGGNITIPVRVGPDTLALDLDFTSPTQVGDTVTIPLNATVTAGLQPGLRFTSGTTVTLYTGPLTRDTSIFKTPLEFTIDPDSMHLSFKPGPNSTGRARITGIANVSTPSLATFARTGAILKTDEFDTAGSTRLALVPATAAIGDTITVTLPPEYRFTPGTTINYFTEQPNGSMLNTNGQAAPFKISTSADSGTIQYLPGPGVSGQPRFTGIVVRETPVWIFAARSIDSTFIDSIPYIASTFSNAAPAVNQTLTVTLPAGFKTRPTSAATGGTPYATEVISRAADSSSMVILPPPGYTGTITLTQLQNSLLGPLALSLPTDDTITVASAATIPNAGDDNALAGPVPVINVNLAVGEATVLYDQGTYVGGDSIGFGGPQQDYELNFTNAGNYTVRYQWSGSQDVDILTWNSTFTALIGGQAGATGANPEVVTANFPTGTVWLTTGIWQFSGSRPSSVKISIRRNP